MANDLDMLLKLQAIDYDLGELERSKEYLPDMMESLSGEISETESKFKAATESLTESKVRQKSLEIELSSTEAELQKFQQQMMSIKTNREYDALVAQIDTVKETISDSETELLETIEKISELEQELVGLEEQAGQVKDNNTKQLSVLQEKVDSIGDKVTDRTSHRQKITLSIPKPTLAIYERVRRGKGGAVVVVVKKRACGACYKALTPKKVQEIRRADCIHTCDNCGRLLFWDNETSA